MIVCVLNLNPPLPPKKSMQPLYFYKSVAGISRWRAMTCIHQLNQINLKWIKVELTCSKSYIPWAPSCQFTRNGASRHDGKLSSLFLHMAICLEYVNIVPSCPLLWSSSLFSLTSEHVADNITRQEICRQASKDALYGWWMSIAKTREHVCSERVACHDRCTSVDVQYVLLKVQQSLVVYMCVYVCVCVNVLATSWCEDSTPSPVISLRL